MEKTIGSFEARRRFAQIIEETHYQKDHFIIERSGRPMAVIIPVDDYKRFKQLSKERVFATIGAIRELNKDVPEEELDADIERALEMLRQELLAEQTAKIQSSTKPT